jgi:hypothetical protein
LGKKIMAQNEKQMELERITKDVYSASEEKILMLTQGEKVAKMIPFFVGEDMATAARKKRESDLIAIGEKIGELTGDFVKIRGKVKSLENIRGKRQSAYQRMENRKEQNELEELYNIRKSGKGL